jgi:phosphoserine phosphatase
VLLLRHGRSTLNDMGCYQGSSDRSDLTARGHEASQQVGQFLQACPIDRIYVSPLRRAQQSLQALQPELSRFSGDVITSSLLREIDLPAWEGLPYHQVKIRFAKDYHCWQNIPEQFAMRLAGPGSPQFYPVQALYRRAQTFWQATLPRHSGQTLLVISHGGTLQALVNTALGFPMAKHHALQQTHSGLTVLDFEAPALGLAHLHLLNLTTPIGEYLPKLKAGKQGVRLVLLPCRPNERTDPALGALLTTADLSACLVEDQPTCHQALQALPHHQAVAQAQPIQSLQVLPQWHQAITQALVQPEPQTLTTILAIAHETHIASFLKQRLGGNLMPQPHTFTVLHFPLPHRSPILQTLNARPTLRP